MRDFELQFSDKLITPWGGMALIKRMLDPSGVERALAERGRTATGQQSRLSTRAAHHADDALGVVRR